MDQQVAFPCGGRNKIDICYYDPSAERLVFAVVRRIDDPRLLVPKEQPELVDELKACSAWIERERDAIVSACTEVIRLKRQLGLGDRLQGVPQNGLSVETKPVLVIGYCTPQEVREMRSISKGEHTNTRWSGLWKHLADVCCGVILCGADGCRLDIRRNDRRRWHFGK